MQIYTPTSDLTIFEITEFKAQLQAGLDLGQGVMIDLGQTSTLDASAIQLLIAACRTGSVQLINIPSHVASRLTLLGWDRTQGLVTS